MTLSISRRFLYFFWFFMYIFGRNTIVEALTSGKTIDKIFVSFGAQGEAIDRIWTLAKKRGVPCGTMDRRKFSTLQREIDANDERTQGVIALVSELDVMSVSNLIERCYEQTESPVLVALDGITDPHNLGAIARSAEGAGVSGLIIPERNAAPLTGTAVKVSAGALEHVLIGRAPTISIALQDARNAGFTVIGTDDKAENLYTEALYEGPVLLVLGSEGEGMHPAVRKQCDHLVRIPMAGKVSSLNASVSAGVILFEIVRQRSLHGESENEVE